MTADGTNLQTNENALEYAGIILEGLNIIRDNNYKGFRVFGVAKTASGKTTSLLNTNDTWVIGAIAKDAEGKVVGVGDSDVSLHYSPIAAFDIHMFPHTPMFEDVESVELYPFVRRVSY